ncbi:MAG: hypothetical protein GY820_35550 [Gammaproteobacteria bacterium]|nr:hypothetical protein [Gammaproteobacteria bacterium]
MQESGAQTREEGKKADQAAVKGLLSDCGIDPSIEIRDIFRLGRFSKDQPRPRLLKVVFTSESEVAAILSKKVNLKGKEKWNGVRIRRSMTKSERVHLSLCFARSQQLNSTRSDRNESPENVFYFVRPNESYPRVLKKQGDSVLWSWRDSGNV